MKFNNRSNTPHKIGDKVIWDNRSPAVECTILMNILSSFQQTYVLASKRGPNAADFQGYWNLICGYLDWDETGSDAIIREVWEEVGLNLREMMTSSGNVIVRNDLHSPWDVITNPWAHLQNVSLRYGIYFISEGFPKLSTKNNEVDGEVSELLWMPIQDINKYKWAFDHNQVIRNYLEINKIKM